LLQIASSILVACSVIPVFLFARRRLPWLPSYLIAAALNLQVGEKQALLAERRTDERLGLELRILRKEIGLLREMVAHAGSAQARASLN